MANWKPTLKRCEYVVTSGSRLYADVDVVGSSRRFSTLLEAKKAAARLVRRSWPAHVSVVSTCHEMECWPQEQDFPASSRFRCVSRKAR